MDETTGELGGDEPGAPSAWSFSTRVAKDWEASFFETETPFTRKVALRSAITFSPAQGGAFAVLINLVRLGLGGTQGNGRQYVSWIHHVDFARAIDFIIEREDIAGCVNICAPTPLENSEFMRGLRSAWGTHLGLPAPGPLMEIGAIVLGTETELVLKSRRVVPSRLIDAGFSFDFPEWPAAAQDLVRQWKAGPR